MSTERGEQATSQPKHSYPGVERKLGVYPQRQEGLFMQRIKVVVGRITWQQWRTVARLAERYSSGTDIHVTTRQDIELHNIAGSDIQAVQEALAKVGLTTTGACGDSVRNITVCSGCRFAPDSRGVFALAHFVHRELSDRNFDLPRKFKISFSGCLWACARPWLSDLGFVTQHDGRFTVIGAGSLGPKPALGIELYRNLAVKDVLPLCLAALQFFEETGNRKNRNLARFRHVRERLGDGSFKAELYIRFGKLKSSQQWPDYCLTPPNQNLRPLWRLQLPNGNISPAQAFSLADAAEPKESVLRINIEHALEIFGSQSFELPAELATLKDNPAIITCPGISTCTRALVDGWKTADKIREALRGSPDVHRQISISGCPNNCAHSSAADIGLIGQRRKQKGQLAGCYRLLVGGGNGCDNRLAHQAEIIAEADAPAAVKHAATFLV